MPRPRLHRWLGWMAAGVLAALVAAAPAARAAAPGHAGRWLTSPAGAVLIVHGLNMVDKVAPYAPDATGFGNDDAAFLARLGFDVVRVGVIWKALEPSPGRYDDRYLRRIAGTVRTLARHGVWSLLDFHQDMFNERFHGEGAPDWAVQDDGMPNPDDGFPVGYVSDPALQRAEDHFWANAPGPGGVGLQDRYAAAWRHVARTFRSLPGVLGYELLNEPSAGAQFAMCLGVAGCPAFDAVLTGFDRRVARAIRSVDRRTLVFAEPDVGFDFGVATHVRALGLGPAGFAFHDYCLVLSASGCASEPRALANALAHVARTHEALLLTEFGSNPFVGDLSGMVALADRTMVPWIEWSYCPCRDPTGATPDPLVLDPRRPPVGANVGRLALATLVEPFPQLIAGTPLAWRFDRVRRVFTLRYSTGRADGYGRFGAGARTRIATPRAIYTGGYGVTVRGGSVVSPPGASVLEIAACRGARRVAVTVRPGAGRAGPARPRRSQTAAASS